MFQVKSFWCVKLVGFFASFLWGCWCSLGAHPCEVVRASLAQFLLSSCSTEAGQCCLSWEFSPFLRATYWKRNCVAFSWVFLTGRASYSVTPRAFGNMQHACLVHLLGSVSAMRCSGALFFSSHSVYEWHKNKANTFSGVYPWRGLQGWWEQHQLSAWAASQDMYAELWTSKRRLLCMTFPRNLWHVVPHQGSLFSDNVTFYTPTDVLNPHRIHYVSF